MTTSEEIQNLEESEYVADLLLNEIHADECQTCGRCVFEYGGIAQLEMTLSDIMKKKGRSSDLSLMEELCGLVKTQSLCGTGGGITDVMLAATETHHGDFEERIGGKGCEAGTYRKFMTCHTLVDRCTDCGDYMDECEEDTVLGKKRFIRVIDQDECTQCGACMSVYEEDAVVETGAVRPKCPCKPIPCRW